MFRDFKYVSATMVLNRTFILAANKYHKNSIMSHSQRTNGTVPKTCGDDTTGSTQVKHELGNPFRADGKCSATLTGHAPSTRVECLYLLDVLGE